MLTTLRYVEPIVWPGSETLDIFSPEAFGTHEANTQRTPAIDTDAATVLYSRLQISSLASVNGEHPVGR